MSNFEIVWKRIKDCEGQEFSQIRGKTFTYECIGNIIIPSTTNHQFAKSEIKKAYELCPLENTVPIQKLRGPSYLYAILMDNRIRMNDW
jgi:hypothetical protein